MGRSPCCEKEHTKKGAWTQEEDQRLINYITREGEGNWRILPKAAGLLRCGKSCRLRWINYLRPDLKRGHFTLEEDEVIIKLHSLLGNKWSLISGRLPGRTGYEIKNYWNTHIKRKLLRNGIDPQTHRPFNSTATSAAVNTTATNTYLDFRNSIPPPSKEDHITLRSEPTKKISIPTTDNSSSVDDTKCNSNTTEESHPPAAADSATGALTKRMGEEHDLSTVLGLEGYDEEYSDVCESFKMNQPTLFQLGQSNMFPVKRQVGHIALLEHQQSNDQTVDEMDHVTGVVIQEKQCTTPVTNSEKKEETSRKIENGKRKTGLSITLEDLEAQFGKSRKDAAENLGVSISTFKRACRDHDIHRWPSNKKHRKNPSLFMTKNANEYDGDPQQSTGPSSSNLGLPVHQNVPPTNTESNQDLSLIPETDLVIIKAKYEDEIVKFQFCLSSGIDKLAEEVATRINLEMGTFKLKYVDEDDDHISLTCDADLQLYVKSLKEAGKNCIPVFVQLIRAK